jgi:hypothetical protein
MMSLAAMATAAIASTTDGELKNTHYGKDCRFAPVMSPHGDTPSGHGSGSVRDGCRTSQPD